MCMWDNWNIQCGNVRLSVTGVYEYFGEIGAFGMGGGSKSMYHGTPTCWTLVLTLIWSCCKTDELCWTRPTLTPGGVSKGFRGGGGGTTLLISRCPLLGNNKTQLLDVWVLIEACWVTVCWWTGGGWDWLAWWLLITPPWIRLACRTNEDRWLKPAPQILQRSRSPVCT